jgi:chromosomal replication initiator protein
VPQDREPSPPDDLSEVWDAVVGAARSELTDATFHIWIEPLEPAGRAGDVLYVRAPDHIRTWVEDRFAGVLGRAARRAAAAQTVQVVDPAWKAAALAPTGGGSSREAGLNPRYTFDQFVICDGNRLAHGAALAVAEQPAQAYNPLFVHGRPGLGKTHLLHAIGNYVRAYGADLRVRYATGEAFTGEFVRAIRSGDTRAFQASFRDADVLLVDDVQFLAEKVRTEDEFFHTFNALYEAGSQLVITSDRPPRDLDALELRLRERFECGLVALLEPPGFEARLAILEKRARADALAGVPPETLAAIAETVTSSVRTLEGALVRVVAYASLRGEAPGPDLARHVLGTLYGAEQGRPATLAEIQAAAASAVGVAEEALLAHDRRPKVALARQVAMYLARELTDASLPAIGRHFGGRNHSTVLHAHRRIAADVQSTPATRDAVEQARRRLTSRAVDRP